MRWLWARRRWAIGLVVRLGIAGGFCAWWEYGWRLDDVRFDLDWLVWAGTVLAGYLLMRHVWAPWRKAVTHETKLRWWHKLIMRVPVVSTVVVNMAKVAQRLGIAGGVKHAYAKAFERGMKTRGSGKRRHTKQIDNGVADAIAGAVKEMGLG